MTSYSCVQIIQKSFFISIDVVDHSHRLNIEYVHPLFHHYSFLSERSRGNLLFLNRYETYIRCYRIIITRRSFDHRIVPELIN